MNEAGFGAPQIEAGAVSAMMQWEACVNEAKTAGLTSDHFTDPRCRTLFDLVVEQWEKGKKLDLIAFTQLLSDRGLLKSLGGAPFITELFASTCYSPLAMGEYISVLHERTRNRLVFKGAAMLAQESQSATADQERLLELAGRIADAIAIGSKQLRGRTLAELVDQDLERLETGLPGGYIIATGLIGLDEASPLYPEDMPVIAGVRKAGKTALAVSIALNIAQNGRAVLYFMLEDSAQKTLARFRCGLSRVPRKFQAFASMTPEQIQKTRRAAEQLRSLPIQIRDDVFTLPEISAVTKDAKARHNIGLVIVDYAQLVQVVKQKDRTREQEVAEVSRTLRLLAIELKTPIIVLSQLNPEGFTRESRALENDCSAMWRIDKRKNPKKSDDEEPEDEEGPNVRWLRIPFQRNGESPVGFKVSFFGEFSRVDNYSSEQ